MFPRTIALEAAANLGKALKPVVYRMEACADLRRELATLGRIEFVIETPDREPVIKAMKSVGWSKPKPICGPLVFPRANFDEDPRFPEAVIRVAHSEEHDLLEVTSHGNFEVLLFLCTGTGSFHSAMNDRINEMGLVMRPAQGLFRGATLVAWTEVDIFRNLGLRFIPPAERDCGRLGLRSWIIPPTEGAA
jgi:DNA polymerase/3'-5' exonuclease PolX